MNATDDALPAVHAALLDDDTLTAFFRDLASLAEIQEVLLKGGPRAHAQERSVPLEQAREALLQGAVMGVQIRYRYQGGAWWDTLLRTPEGLRLVRIQSPAA